MLVLKFENVKQEKKSSIRKWTYASDQFFGPFYDFIEITTGEKVLIKFERSYSEDAKYANMTRLEMACKAIEELLCMYDSIFLSIWGHELQFTTGDSVSEKLSLYVLKHVSF